MAEVAILIVTLLLVAAFAFLVVGQPATAFFFAYWKVLTFFGLLIAPLGIWYLWHRRKTNDLVRQAGVSWEVRETALRRQIEEDARLEPIRRAAVKITALQTLGLLREAVASDFLILDSNAWMNEAFDTFFRVLRRCATESQRQIVLSAPQFNEICNRKRTTSEDDPVNRRARLAISRIEQLQKEGLLRIAKTPIELTRDPHADPLEVSILIAEAKPANSIHFISDDEELRIRIRECLRKHPSDRWKVLDFSGLLPGCEAVAEAEKLGLINDEPSALIQLCPPSAQSH